MKMFYALGYENEDNTVKYFKLKLHNEIEVGVYFQSKDESIVEVLTQRNINEITKGIKGVSEFKLVPIVSTSQRKMMKDDLEIILGNSEAYTGSIIDKVALGKKI